MRRSRADALTGDLFAAIPKPWRTDAGAMDFRAIVAALLSQMLAEAHAANAEHDRYWIAAYVSRLVGKEVSKSMLDGYTAEARETFNMPFYLVAALEVACGSKLLTEWLASVRGGRFLPGAEALDAEIGRLQGEIESARDHMRSLQELRKKVR